MSIGSHSKRRILGYATVIILSGIITVGFSIGLNPPTSDIPEPSFSYSTLDNLFKYYNNTAGGAVTNSLEFYISFDNFQDGSAFLRLTSALITIWVADNTTHQPNTTLMQYDPVTTELRINPSRDQNQLDIIYNNSTNGEWFATGTCEVKLGTNEMFPNNIIIVDYGFMISNDLAREFDGHQFLIKIQADITYGAIYLGGLVNWQYQSSTFEYVLGNESSIYMLPIET